MSASLVLRRRPKRRATDIRRVKVLGKEYRDAGYRPQFALGIVCHDEQDQQSLFQRLTRLTKGRDVKVLVI